MTAAAEAAPLRRVAGIRAAMARVGVRRAAGRMAAVTKTAVGEVLMEVAATGLA